MNNEAVFDSNQFVVSHELLQLLQWLIDYEPEALKALISQVLDDGLHEQIISSQDTPIATTTELQQSIVDFFTLLEVGMHDSPDNNEDIRLAHKSMIPAIDHIDTNMCGESTLATSIAQATSQLKTNTCANAHSSAKETLCKELLKNWNPQNNRQVN